MESSDHTDYVFGSYIQRTLDVVNVRKIIYSIKIKTVSYTKTFFAINSKSSKSR